VGGYAVQLAAQAGATVAATASARSVDRIRSYRADRVVEYTATPSCRHWPGSSSTWC
jgi:NADPH:quinone reductase-like Zn-dependent oxidoreductase